MAEPRKRLSRWILWVLAIAIVGGMAYIIDDKFLCIISSLVRHPPRQDVIRNTAAGLEAFKQDWGLYPPSTNGLEGAKGFGYQCLAYYLMGPAGKGWGKPANGATPIGGKSEATYGPYFRQDSSATEGGIVDSFQPAKLILYYRFNRDRDPPYYVRDNPVDPTCVNGFASQEHFELLVRPKDAGGNRKWVREDYLLISPDADRCYGYVAEDKATGKMRPARPEEIEKGEATCDDITNFRY